MMMSEHSGPLNMGSSHEVSIRQFAEEVIALAGSESEIEYHPLLHPDDPKRRRPALDRVEQALGFEATTDLETGLQNTLDWFRQVIEDR